ncbi:putative LRR-like protein kinase 3, partial [Scleroderma citrinum]
DIPSELRYLHTHELGPILHGDLNGTNVLVSSDHQALLADFGLSTMRSCTFSMTVELPCGGSLAWMAPELLKGNDASVTSDIRAFAMI